MTNSSKSKLMSAAGILTVTLVISAAFIWRSQIERFAATGYVGVFIACLAATSTVLLPAPGVFVVIQYAQILNPLAVVLLGGLGTSLGEMTGYFLGRSGREIVSINSDSKVMKWLGKRTYLMSFIFSLIPLPVFDIAGVTAGMIKADPLKFWICCLAGKTLKMGIYVTLFSYAGDLVMNLK